MVRVLASFVKATLTLGREIIRGQVPKAVFHVFNWTFISFIQSILLFMIAAPVYTILLASTIEPNLTSADLASVAIELGLILTEYIADEQQWGKPALPHTKPAQH
jgi:steroid 5-alpha reductase family enzyme